MLSVAFAQNKSEVSWYGKEWHGRKTASGQVYNVNLMTAAVVRKKGSLKPALPFGSKVEITYGSQKVIVTINDTGSYRPRKASMWFDLSPAAFKKLTSLNKGRIVATYRVISYGGKRGKS